MFLLLFHRYHSSFFDVKGSIHRITQEGTAGYVGGEKKMFGVLFICMNCFPKSDRHFPGSEASGRRGMRSALRRSRQKER